MNVYEDLLTKQNNEKRENRRDFILTVAVVLLCAFLLFVKFVWFYCVEVDGTSMNYTLNHGDLLLVDKLCDIDRGDVVVFTLDDKAYIKRVVAVEGDTVKIKDGKLFVKYAGEQEFTLVEYSGVKGDTYYLNDPTNEFKREISKDCYFVLGDNRENSTDSRMLGEIKKDCMNGVVHQFIIDNKDGALGKIYKFL